MRWLRAVGVVAAFTVAAQVAQARTPAFVRQTGLVCNQCHMSWTPAPDFTFTGMKFRLNGFRIPWVAEKVEAGDEGAVNGQRLVLTLGSMLSWHVRGLVVGGSTPAGDPSLPAPTASAPASELIQTVGMHYAGPIGEHVGIWNEFYMYGGGLGPTTANGNAGGNRNGYIGLSHFDIVLSTTHSGNVYGFAGRLQPSGNHSFMTVMSDGTPSNMLRTPGLSGSSAPYVYWAVYGFWADRVGLEVGLEPGEDNLDWKRFNYHADAGYFLRAQDAGWYRLGVQFKAGNDMVPGVSSLRASNDGLRTLVPTDAVTGISATRVGGLPLSSLNMGDATRLLLSFAGGFIDHGPHSLVFSVSQSIESESYNDRSASKMQAVGGEMRYYYNRTYGLTLDFNTYEKWNYTDALGVLHDIPMDPTWSVQATYRLAMNFAIYGTYGNSQRSALDENWLNGKDWGLYMQYLW